MDNFFSFSDVLPTLSSIAALTMVEMRLLVDGLSTTLDGMSITDFLDLHAIVDLPAVFLPASKIAELPHDGFPQHIKNVPIKKAIYERNYIRGEPKLRALREWRDQGITVPDTEPEAPAAEPEVDESRLLHLPAKRKAHDNERMYEMANHLPDFRTAGNWLRRFDPIRLVNALGFSRHLTSPKYFKEALQASHEYETTYVDDDHPELMKRDDEGDPGDTCLKQAHAVLDPVAMLLTRRQMRHIKEWDALDGVNLYSDSSPVVGAELQGMVMDCHLTDGSYHRLTLPGSLLAYGYTHFVAKTMALIWAIHLLVGSDEEMLTWFFSHVVSITTDYGVELSTALVCDVVKAFVLWLRGVPITELHSYVKKGSRLMPYALRMGGWSHSLGNSMKDVCSFFPEYPNYLTSMRKSCTFWRNHGYRSHVARLVRAPAHLDFKKKLKSFGGSFVKWRYETLHTVIGELLNLRALSEEYMHRALFGAVEDEGLLKDVLAACKDKAFWRWMQAAWTFIFKPLEELRRWGMVCPCCEDARKEKGGPVKCEHNRESRRLHQAVDHVRDVMTTMQGTANNLTLEDVEGDKPLHTQIVNALRGTVNLLNTRFKYLKALPWCMCKADTRAGATEVIEKWERISEERHDPVTINLVKPLLPDLVAMRDTGICSDALADRVRRIKLTPLDESAGEGYHRGTHLAQLRAMKRAKVPWIKGATRFKQNIGQVRGFLHEHGKRGRAVVREEWFRYKRVLQTSSKFPYRPVDLTRKAFFSKLYRMDDQAKEDWTPLAAKLDIEVPKISEVDDEDDKDNEALRKEYYRAIFRPSRYYRIERRVERMSEDGVSVRVSEPFHFQVVKINSGVSRIKTISTVESATDIADTAQIALCVQELSEWQPHPEVPDTSTHGSTAPPPPQVYADADLVWRLPSDIGTFTEMSEKMVTYECIEPSHVVGCQILAQPISPEPQLALTDAHCPTYMIIRHLRQEGWRTRDDMIVHSNDNLRKTCNNNGGPRIKPYLQCLLDLPKHLALTANGIPTHEPGNFYRCLLAGHRVEAGWGDKTYRRVLKGEEVELPLPIAGPEPPAVLEDDDGEELLGRRGHPEPKRKAKAKAISTPPLEFVTHGRPGSGSTDPLPPDDVVLVLPGADDEEMVVRGRSAAKAKAKAEAKARPDAGRDAGVPAVGGDCTIVFQDYVQDGKPYPNWIITFQAHGRRYQRKRGALPSMKELWGEVEPVAYVHAIMKEIRDGFMDNPRQKPSPEQVAAQITEHGPALEEIRRHFVPDP